MRPYVRRTVVGLLPLGPFLFGFGPSTAVPAAVALACVASGGALFAADTSAEGTKLLGDIAERIVDAQSKEDWGKIVDLARKAGDETLSDADQAKQKKLLGQALSKRGQALARDAFVASVTKNDRAEQLRDRFRTSALIDLEEAIELRPEDVESLLTIAQLHALPDGDRARGVEAAEGVANLSKDQPERRARALILQAQLEEDETKRLKNLDQAVEAYPKLALAWRARAAVRAASGKSDDAIADLRKAIELDPKDLSSLELCLELLVRAQKYDEAVVLVDNAMKEIPKAAPALQLERARLRVRQEKWDEALTDLNELVSKRPEDLLSRMVRAGVLTEQKKYDEALADVRLVRKGAPDASQVAATEADLLRRLKRVDEAVKVMREFIDAHPEDLDARGTLALLFYRVKNYEDAEKELNRLSEAQPDSLPVLRMRASTYVMAGRQKEAIRDYRKLLATDAEDESALNNLAWMLATSPDDALRDGKAAIETARKAAELTEFKKAYILSTLAAGYAETGDFKTALEWISKAEAVSDDPKQKKSLAEERKTYEGKKPWREAKPASEDEADED